MSTKRELERNEKVIRGLMKLPPNRRCINCNSLGPQYVCTNFWTFVCMICSGIHREFTHRVKSVSMSKFTSQEVESLQNGGNQRAREIFLKDWDLDRQRQPNSSNVDKVREFIKSVYVDRHYASGNNSEKPPQGLQSQRSVGDETRRASSYHSFSQSPPYDFQYEDWLIRKHKGGSINRKPGYDHNLYDRKVGSSIYSPGRLSEDGFANEGSSSRVSDYSFSSGDPFKSEPQSPNLQKDNGFSSPTSDSSRETYDGLHHQIPSTYSETYAKVDKVPLRQPQRTVSLGSVGSFEKSSVSLHSEFKHSTITTQNKAFGTPPPSMPVSNSGEINLFKDAVVMPVPHSASGVDLFQGQNPGSVASMDLFHKPADSSALSQDYPSNFCSSSTICQNLPTPDSNKKLCEPSKPSNEGWATFDLPQPSPPSHKTVSNLGSKAELEHPVGSFGPSAGGLQRPKFQNPHIHSPPLLVSNPWSEDLQNAHVATNMSSSQIWKPFDEAIEHHQCNDTHLQASVGNASSNIDLFASFGTQQDFDVDGLQQIASTTEGFSFQTLPSNVSSGSSFVEPRHPFMQSDMRRQNSGNPFDVLFDSKSEAHNTFLDMGTLQTALSSAPLPSSYMGDTNKPWFPGNAVTSPGGMLYTIPEARSSQLQNVPTQGPVASYGGNPFA